MIKQIKNNVFAFFAIVVASCFFAGCTPSGPKALLQGEELLKQNHPEEAVKKMEKAVKYMPNNAIAWNYLGIALHRSQKINEALDAYQQAANCNPNLAPLDYNRGCAYLDKRNYQMAISSLNNFRIKNETYAPVWEKLGYAYLAINQITNAFTCFHNVLQLEPKNAKVANTIGLMFAARNDIANAFQYFRYSASEDETYSAPILNMAILLQSQPGETNMITAIQYYNAYISRSPRTAMADKVRNQVAHLNARLETKTAIQALTKNNVIETITPKPETTSPVTNTVSKPSTPQEIVSTARVEALSPDPVTPKTSTTNTFTTNTTVANVVIPSRTVNEEQPKTTTNIVASVPKAVIEPEESEPVLTPQSVVIKAADGTTNTTSGDVVKTATVKPVETTPEEIDLSKQEAVTIASTSADQEIYISDSEENSREAKAEGEIKPQYNEQAAPATPEKKKNFFSSLFSKKDDSNPKRVTPITSAQREAATKPEPRTISVIPNETIPEENNVEPATSQKIYVYDSYIYLFPEKPAAGDRAAATPDFQKAYRAQQGRDLPTAIDYYVKALKKDPSWTEAYSNLGLAYYGIKKYDLALTAFETALVIDPNSWETRYNFALALDAANYPNETVLELKKVTQQNPEYADAWLELGLIYDERFSDTENAYKSYKRFVEVAPDNPSAGAVKSWLVRNANKVTEK